MKSLSLARRCCAVLCCLAFFAASFSVLSYADYQPIVDPAPGYSLAVKPSNFDFSIVGEDESPAIVDSLSNGNYRVKGTQTGDTVFGVVGKNGQSIVDYINQFKPGDQLQFTFSYVSPVEQFIPYSLSLRFWGTNNSYTDITDMFYVHEVYYKKSMTPETQYIINGYWTVPDNVDGLHLRWLFTGDYSNVNGTNKLPVLYFRDGYISPYGDTLARMRTEKSQQEIIGSDDNEETASGIKGILLWIKSIPEKLGELLKKLFIPTEEQITDFKDKTEDLLTSRLGVVWESGQLIYSSAAFFYLFKPDKEPSLTFPALKVNMSDKGEFSEGQKNSGTNFVMWEEQTLKFDFLKENPYKLLYDLYKVVVCGMFVCIVINYAYRKGEKILSGSEG